MDSFVKYYPKSTSTQGLQHTQYNHGSKCFVACLTKICFDRVDGLMFCSYIFMGIQTPENVYFNLTKY